MPVNFLEQLTAEWFEYRGYFVRRNVKVGKRQKGGHDCELDVVPKPEQIALMVFAPRTRERSLAGGRVMHVSAFLGEIVQYFKGFSMMSAGVPEGFPILRTLQFVVEYRKHLFELER